MEIKILMFLFILLFIIITQFVRFCAKSLLYIILNFILFDLIKHFAISCSGKATKLIHNLFGKMLKTTFKNLNSFKAPLNRLALFSHVSHGMRSYLYDTMISILQIGNISLFYIWSLFYNENWSSLIYLILG